MAHKHMFGTAETNALGTKAPSQFSVGRCISIGAHSQFSHLVGPVKQGIELFRELRI